MNHTPGPWEFGRSDMATLVDGVQSKWIYAGEQYVAVASGHIDGDWKQVIANARLIASAPDLLKALVMIRDWDDYNYQNKLDMIPITIRLFIEEAIRKATGEQK